MSDRGLPRDLRILRRFNIAKIFRRAKTINPGIPVSTNI
jgi:hypothetical protein